MSPLQSSAFRAIVVGRLTTATAMTLFRATVLWQLWEDARDPLALAQLGLAQFVPGALASLVSGSVADTHDRRRVALGALAACAALATTVATVSHLGLSSPGVLVVLAMLSSTLVAFEPPARMAMLPRIVGLEHLPRALTLQSALGIAGFMTGPVLAGSLLSVGTPAWCYALQAALLGVSFALTWSVPASMGPPESPAPWRWRSIVEGLSFVRGQPLVLGSMALDMAAVVFGGATALLPVMAREALHVGASEYGLLAAALDAGAVSATTLLSLRAPIRRVGQAMLGSVVAYGLATAAFGVAPTFPTALLAYALVGAADAVSVVTRGVTIQLNTPDALRGRVTSVSMIFIGASNQLGAVESGLVAHFLDVRSTIVVGGLAAVAVALAMAAFHPTLRRYEVQRPPAEV